MKKKLALCIPLNPEDRAAVEKYCDITECGFLKSGRLFMPENETLPELLGHEIVVTMSETTGKESVYDLRDSGMKFLIAARGTPTMTDWQACHDCGIPLGYTPGRNSVAVAEFTLMLILMLAKKVNQAIKGLQQGCWLGEPVSNIYDYVEKKDVNWPHDATSPFGVIGYGSELFAKRVGIVGFGAIGQKVGARCAAFGMEVTAYDAYYSDDKIRELGAEPLPLEELLRTSDIISIHLPVTDETRFMVNENWFSLMKPTALFINTARAAVIKQEALMDALETGMIAGAAMDVFWEEPIPANHPLLQMDNVIVTPHMAAMTEEIDSFWTSRMVAQLIVDYCNGKPAKYQWKRLS